MSLPLKILFHIIYVHTSLSEPLTAIKPVCQSTCSNLHFEKRLIFACTDSETLILMVERPTYFGSDILFCGKTFNYTPSTGISWHSIQFHSHLMTFTTKNKRDENFRERATTCNFMCSHLRALPMAMAVGDVPF